MKRDQKILEYITLTIATIILDVGVYFFKFPNNFSFGGVTGLAVVLSQVTALRASTLNFPVFGQRLRHQDRLCECTFLTGTQPA